MSRAKQKPAANENIDWNRASYNPVALLILPWPQGGCTMAHRDKSGTLHGCRDISNKSPTDYAVCAAAWINDAKQKGLTVEDRADVFAAIEAASNNLMAATKRLGHVGGSILPSNSTRILKPVTTPFGELRVRIIAELDTHGLFHKHATGESLLATHPNGYSCHVLLEAMAAGDVDAACRQAEFILACGGTARHIDHIIESMKAPENAE